MAKDSSANQAEALHRRWRLVKQAAADTFLLIVMASFGTTVIVVRVLLELSGYPQIGDSTFHLAHLLWGGLLLFLGLLMLLLFSNRWLLWIAAVMGGIGVGLFIDEVGKFITKSNDYFFPLAFPIIYAFMLICVWVYLRVRRHRHRDTRTMLYHALDDLKQVLDNDLDPFEHADLLEALDEIIGTATDPNQRRLASALQDFVTSQDMRLASAPMWIERFAENARVWLAHHPSRKVLKGILVVGYAATVVQTWVKAFGLLSVTSGISSGFENWKALISQYVIVSGKSSYVVQHPTLLLVNSALVLLTGILALMALVYLLKGREQLGLRAGTFALVLALTIVNLITFYFNQLYTIADAMGQLLLLFATQVYRWRFYAERSRG